VRRWLFGPFGGAPRRRWLKDTSSSEAEPDPLPPFLDPILGASGAGAVVTSVFSAVGRMFRVGLEAGHSC
jgi:hypothetical protein